MSCESKIAGGGRPAQYTTEIAMAICERLCDGETLRAVCADPGMPDKATVRDWLARYPEFRKKYESALQGRAEDLAWEVIEIVDDSKGDYVEKVRNGKVVTVFDRYNRARRRLRCDVRRWVVERLAPNGFSWVEPKGLSDGEPE
jgi:Bacteriophage Sf6, terminase small subunit-like